MEFQSNSCTHNQCTIFAPWFSFLFLFLCSLTLWCLKCWTNIAYLNQGHLICNTYMDGDKNSPCKTAGGTLLGWAFNSQCTKIRWTTHSKEPRLKKLNPMYMHQKMYHSHEGNEVQKPVQNAALNSNQHHSIQAFSVLIHLVSFAYQMVK